jgi:hypothetical protein
MRLKKYTPDTVGKQKRGEASIRMNLRGLISFSSLAGDLTGIEHGARLEFCRDEDRPYDWYIHVTRADEGFKVWQNRSSGTLLVNSAGMVREIFSDIDMLETRATFMISAYPVELNGEKFWRIITDNNLKTGV